MITFSHYHHWNYVDYENATNIIPGFQKNSVATNVIPIREKILSIFFRNRSMAKDEKTTLRNLFVRIY